MSTETIERELSELKTRLAELENKMAATPTDQAWRKVVGTSQGDELDREAARLGSEWRARENERR